MTTFTIQPGDRAVAASTPLDESRCARCAGELGAQCTCAVWPADGTTEFRYCAGCAR